MGLGVTERPMARPEVTATPTAKVWPLQLFFLFANFSDYLENRDEQAMSSGPNLNRNNRKGKITSLLESTCELNVFQNTKIK